MSKITIPAYNQNEDSIEPSMIVALHQKFETVSGSNDDVLTSETYLITNVEFDQVEGTEGTLTIYTEDVNNVQNYFVLDRKLIELIQKIRLP